MENKWISIRMRANEIEKIDEFRERLVEVFGVRVSRNAFLRNIIFNNLDYQVSRATTSLEVPAVCDIKTLSTSVPTYCLAALSSYSSILL